MIADFIEIDQSGEWESALAPWPAPACDVYFSAGYHRAFAVDQTGRAILFSFQEGAERLVYPFFLRRIEQVGQARIEENLSDIEGVYGFSGPLSTTEDRAFLQSAWEAFSRWCTEQHVIAEFVRFHPLLRNERFADPRMSVSTVRQHVILDLQQSEEEIWSQYTSVNRNMIRKARKAGVDCVIAPLASFLDRFRELYRSTMDRNTAAPTYYFSDRHFDRLAKEVPQLACAATLDGQVVAVSIFLLGPQTVHYHLSGSAPAALKIAANNLILHGMVLEAKRRGYRQVHFGGGRSGESDDSLLKFKANFSAGRVPVCIGRRVHDSPRYTELCNMRRSQMNSVPESYFLAYRFETVRSVNA